MLLLVLLVVPVRAQLTVRNAASLVSHEVPGGAIAQGSLFTIRGIEAFEIEARQTEYPLTDTLEGLRIEITTAGGEVFHALPLSVGIGSQRDLVATPQVQAILPSNTPIGEHRLDVLVISRPAGSGRIKVVRSSPGIFTGTENGGGVVAGRSLLDPANPGGRATLWVTGLGPNPGDDVLAPQPGEISVDLTVTIGAIEAEVLYQGRSPCCAGLDQVEIVVPADAPLGCFVPVWITAYGSQYSNIATLPIAGAGGDCWQDSDADPFLRTPQGRFTIEQFRSPDEATSQVRGYAKFAAPESESPTLVPFGHGYDPAYLPPAGSCRVSHLGSFAPLDPAVVGATRSLNGGREFTLETPSGQSELTLRSSPFADFLGTQPMMWSADPPVALLPGEYRLLGEGGPDFPSFNAELSVGPFSRWTNRDSLAQFPRDEPVLVKWQGGEPGTEQLTVAGWNCLECASGGFPGLVDPERLQAVICRAARGATSLEIPDAFLANLSFPNAFVSLVNLPRPAEMQFATDGPESGLVIIRDSESVPLSLDLPHLASTPVTLPDGSLVQAELAANSSERQRGLMFRPSLKPNGGMLFLFNQSARWSFWMFNTLIPLDIIWLNEDREIIFINQDTPPCPGQPCPVYGPNAVSRSVLELAAGEAARRNLQLGDQLDW